MGYKDKLKPYSKEKGHRAFFRSSKGLRELRKAADHVKTLAVRYVEVSDSVQQALLEMYVAITLRTKHNDFDNH